MLPQTEHNFFITRQKGRIKIQHFEKLIKKISFLPFLVLFANTKHLTNRKKKMRVVGEQFAQTPQLLLRHLEQLLVKGESVLSCKIRGNGVQTWQNVCDHVIGRYLTRHCASTHYFERTWTLEGFMFSIWFNNIIGLYFERKFLWTLGPPASN